MEVQYNNIHPRFKFQGIHYSFGQLNEVAYSLIKEGDEDERAIGDFLMDWISGHETLHVKTSGSTGKPKSITLSKQAMVNSALATAAYFGLKEKNTALLCLSANHIAGKMMLVRAMVLGLELDHVPPTSTPLSGITREYDFCAMVPMQAEKSIKQLGKIKTLIVGGGPISPELENSLQKKKLRIFETYGMTETCSHVAVRQLSGTGVKEKQKTAGAFHTLPGITVTQDKRNCLVLHAKDLSEAPIVTNDVVTLLSDTEFQWLGRFDNVINSGGVKLIPEVIEEKLRPILSERFMVAGVPDKSLGQKLVLIVEGMTNKQALHEKIAGLGTLDKWEMPKDIFTVAHFKTAENGKLLRNEIQKELLQP